MPGVFSRSKIQNMSDVFTGLFEDLKAAGFEQVLPSGATPPTLTAGAGKFVVDSSVSVNANHATQPVRILVDLSGASTPSQGQLRIAVATPLQISTTGVTSSHRGTSTDSTGVRVMGQLGSAWSTAQSTAGSAFFNRAIGTQVVDGGSPMDYLLVVSDRGIAFSLWEQGSDADPKQSLFCAQFPVDKDTGAVIADARTPMFCLYNADNSGFKKFVVSEKDIMRPSVSVPADTNTKNSAAIMNGLEQVSLTRDDKYLLSFPNRLNTDRYAYTHEMDMIAYTSADVIGEGSEVAITLYGEETPRVYRALKAHGQYNSGVRCLVLVSGGGIA